MTKIEPDVVEVTQADRDAAAPFMRVHSTDTGTYADIGGTKSGHWDRSRVVQAFARHRIAALSTLPVSPGSGLADAYTKLRKLLVEHLIDHPHRERARQLRELPTSLRQPSPTAPLTGEQDPLDALAEHTNWELTHGGWEDEEPRWKVHSVNGGRNDREWTLIGTGETPAEAIRAALRQPSPTAAQDKGVSKPCGGCGATENSQRCIGCFHDFGTPESAWVRKYGPAPGDHLTQGDR